MWYEREFPDFDENLRYIYEGLQVPETYDYHVEGTAFQKWIDCSWHNNSAPSFDFIVGSPYDENMYLTLYVDYVDPRKSQNSESREDGSMKRFSLYRENGCTMIYETDTWEHMLYFIKGYVDALKQACVSLGEQDLLRPAFVYRPLGKLWPVYMKKGREGGGHVEEDVITSFFNQ
jgi:hypothetical protein